MTGTRINDVTERMIVRGRLFGVWEGRKERSNEVDKKIRIIYFVFMTDTQSFNGYRR